MSLEREQRRGGAEGPAKNASGVPPSQVRSRSESSSPKGASALPSSSTDAEPTRPSPEWKGVYPGYCIDPETCRGYSHCPRNYSCVE